MEKDLNIRQQLDIYTKETYGVDPEILPFSHEDYEIYRHTDTGKWFAVFVVKERSAFGLDGDGTAEIICVKIADPLYGDFLMNQPGYLRGYPSRGWNWVSAVLDGTVPFEDIRRLLDESYKETKSKAKNLKVPLVKRENAKRKDKQDE